MVRPLRGAGRRRGPIGSASSRNIIR
jgi:hypothetical protein